jgi:hypothetical protein
MAEAILKTWPAFMASRKTLEVFSHEWTTFYFSLGRGKPTRPVSQLWFTHRGRILGNFEIAEIVKNAGQLPKLRSLSNEVSEWQIKRDNWVAICFEPIVRLKENIYYCGFRGWRYFDLKSYRLLQESRILL